VALANGTTFLGTGGAYDNGTNPYQYNNGGEFTAVTTGGIPTGYAASNILSVANATGFPDPSLGFETFCVEDQVDFSPGSDYTYSLGTAIQQGNSVGSLTAGVAWLYEQFAKGTLSGYNFTTQTSGSAQLARLADAGQLQALIWELEGEPADGGDPYSAAPTLANEESNIYWTDLVSHFGSGVAGVNAIDATVTNVNNTYGVDVMELTDGSNNPAQDQLVYVGGAVPDNGTTALLIGVSLLGLAMFRRRLKAAGAR
jgi:hypothetical protein